MFNKSLEKKRLLLLANTLIEEVPDHCNAKEHYESFLRKKNRKLIKQSQIITYKPKTFDAVNIKSDITKHPKTSHKLSKTIRKGEKVYSNNALYSDTKKVKIFWTKKISKYQNENMLLKVSQVLIVLKFKFFQPQTATERYWICN